MSSVYYEYRNWIRWNYNYSGRLGNAERQHRQEYTNYHSIRWTVNHGFGGEAISYQRAEILFISFGRVQSLLNYGVHIFFSFCPRSGFSNLVLQHLQFQARTINGPNLTTRRNWEIVNVLDKRASRPGWLVGLHATTIISSWDRNRSMRCNGIDWMRSYN